MLTFNSLKSGTPTPLYFFVLAFFMLAHFSVSAQQTDTTQQSPTQLETQPQAPERPAPPTRRPAVIPPAPVAPRPAEKEQADTENKEKMEGKKEKEEFDILKKLFIGGSASLGFQNSTYYGNYFNIGASPLLGYKFTKFLAIGPGLIYQFYNMGGYKAHDYGLKGFGQITIYKSILAHFEHSVVSTQDFDVDPSGQVTRQFRQQISSTLIGGGYRSMANERFGMDLYILLPVNYSTDTYNTSYAPVFRAGFIYHLK